MKCLKKILCFIVTIAVLLIPTYGISYDSNSLHEDQLMQEKYERLSEDQEKAVEAHNILFNSFLDDAGQENYPNEYGGDYIKDNILHICIVDLDNTCLNRYTSVLEDYLEVVSFESVNFSYNYLLSQGPSIMKQLLSENVSAISYGIIEPLNSIVIDIEQSELSLFSYVEPDIILDGSTYYELNQYDIPVLLCPQDSTTVSPAYTLMGGSNILNATTNKGLTLGACGYYNGNPAFVTCGHGSSGVGNIFKLTSSNRNIGELLVHQYSNNGSGDYSIVSITGNSMEMTNLVGNPSDENQQWAIKTSINRPAYGTYVYKYGKNGGLAYGKVTNAILSSVTIGSDGVNGSVTIKNLAKCTLEYGTSISGDSGGPIFTGTGSFCGVVSTGESNNSFYFTPYQYINLAGFSVCIN